ncbi:MAG: hypothetical protein H0V66_01840 [Bdellovibrionales bacterium]|nr:hypothetical protein [Bdellovibrionales bacterium]
MKRDQLSTPGLMGFLGQQRMTLSQLVPDGLVGRLNRPVQNEFDLGLKNETSWLTILLLALVILASMWWMSGMFQR